MVRIYYVYPESAAETPGLTGTQSWDAACQRASSMGFDTILIPPAWSGGKRHLRGIPDDPDRSSIQGFANDETTATLAEMVEHCSRYKLALYMDLVLDRVLADGRLAASHADWYGKPSVTVLDPRGELQTGFLRIKLHHARVDPELVSWWGARLQEWAKAGVAGFRCLAPGALPAADWKELVTLVHRQSPECSFMAWTPGMTPDQLARLAPAGFEAGFLSLPWWDYRSSWLVEEHARLSGFASVVSPIEDPDSRHAPSAGWRQGGHQAAVRTLWTAAFTGDGVLMPMGFEELAGQHVVREVNRWIGQKHVRHAALSMLSGPLAEVTALFRKGYAAKLLLVNPDDAKQVDVPWSAVRSRLPDTYTVSNGVGQTLPDTLAPAGCSVLVAVPALMVKRTTHSASEQRKSISAALRSPRIAIENVSPQVDQGRFPIKRTIGDSVSVEADVLMDGHDHIAAQLLWRAADEAEWHVVSMQHAGNDRWTAQFAPQRIGRHYYRIDAWFDEWRTYCNQLAKKSEAGQNVSLEVEEGRRLVSSALERVQDDKPLAADALVSVLDAIGKPQRMATRSRRSRASNKPTDQGVSVPQCNPDQVRTLLSEELSTAMQAADRRPFETASDVLFPITVERRQACFASWYELFPRSQSATPGRHGTFIDVIARLPAIRDMGFDVLYFPPIHPIGLRNRKGKNNSLQAGPTDPGSPYAIGSAEGGHDAIHPELGTLDDFRELVTAAQEHGLEIALDFAIQCSPDHPWLAEHPEWFDWRADGTLRYAENPPKRYEDIVNPDFYSALASAPQQAALWRALRDAVLFWADQGVQTFRVDNPHTKPLPFWEWMIADVQAAHPGTVFLSEAFTRPKMMYRLAKVGFSQSYTYFTWRNAKKELTDYLLELNTPPVADFFRPNFFVNTPDINPYFLQTSGRAGFLIRAALACTTSGLWGMYNGFELCEALAVPGKEEYQDSEKYEIRSWDLDRPGNIVAEITRLNQIRRSNPALQSHLGIRFHKLDNDHVLFFSKTTLDRDNIVLVAISLDPHARQSGMLELPMWEWDLPDDATISVQDVFDDHRFTLHGKYHHVELTPERPFFVWRLVRPG
ncbi:hypothetical protein CR155_07160 [Pollutimonas nitritireducens]|uniref:Alpha-1,4-glucan:maltose-1-phosphate maltosyltransferase n=1 Tax=Pollutimonas nitritireducens TaxID=2045209 RepID=A0A2N4UHP5_9BURK|nr:alpha-1,4-glucan--maltose-1-phosphate maltosyltransferase [Pollutimonas nitritireducens]PLC54542.1 hypothetical protein CR155_07160 [Pollutimonas nitritireducens]